MILVTGSHGFIGKYVCSVLAANGKGVLAVDRKVSATSIEKPAYLSLECDISDSAQIEGIFQKYSFTTIIHLASILNTASRKNPQQATQVNIIGSLNILEAARKFNVARVLYGSSISVYGKKSAQNLKGTSETEPAAPEDVYGAAKRYVEIVGENYQQQFGIQFIALRIASVIGPGAVNTSSPWRSEVFEKLKGCDYTEIVFPYEENEVLPFVYVEDVARMFETLIDAEDLSSAVYNTPSEVWKIGELAIYIRSLDENMTFTFGQSEVRGIPSVIDGQRFMTEFNYTALSLEKRLRQAAQT